MDSKLTLCLPEYTWAKLPFPISWSMTNWPMESTLCLACRLEPEEEVRPAMASCRGGVVEHRKSKLEGRGLRGSPGAYRSGKTLAAVFVVMYTSGGLNVRVR